MSLPAPLHAPSPVAMALVVAVLVLLSEGRRARALIAPGLALFLCALVLAGLPAAGWAWAPLVAGLVAATLARDRSDPLAGECALKLVWVLGGAFALSAVGLTLLVIATGVTAPAEQWGVLALGLTQPMVWTVALPLALLAGVVLLGGAPFHFWVADLFQGAPAALVPLAVAALQALGASWLAHRVAAIAAFPEAEALAGVSLRTAAAAAFLAGAGTLLAQRQPERRVGTLASLQGGLALCLLALGGGESESGAPAWLLPWAAHLALALSGAAVLARLTPSGSDDLGPGGPVYRRHPVAAVAGLYATFSLAGVPGTPGAALWLDVARGLAEAGRTGLLVALALAWIASLTVAVRTVRVGFGRPTGRRPDAPVPLALRLALWLGGAGLVLTMWVARAG